MQLSWGSDPIDFGKYKLQDPDKWQIVYTSLIFSYLKVTLFINIESKTSSFAMKSTESKCSHFVKFLKLWVLI